MNLFSPENPKSTKPKSMQEMFGTTPEEKQTQEKIEEKIKNKIIEIKKKWELSGAIQLIDVSLNKGSSGFHVAIKIQPEYYLDAKGVYDVGTDKITGFKITDEKNNRSEFIGDV